MKKLLVASAVLALTACGGSGTSTSTGAGMTAAMGTSMSSAMSSSMGTSMSSAMSSSTSSSTTANGTGLQSATAPQQPFNIPATQLRATANGNTFTAVYSEMPNPGTMSFGGQPAASSSTISIAISENGMTVTPETTTIFYLPNPYTPLGIQGTLSGTPYQVTFSSITPLPATLTVGESGQLASGSYRLELSGTNIRTGTFTETYAVTADTASTVKLTLTSMLNNISGPLTTTFTVSATGQIKLVSADVTINETTYTFM